MKYKDFPDNCGICGLHNTEDSNNFSWLDVPNSDGMVISACVWCACSMVNAFIHNTLDESESRQVFDETIIEMILAASSVSKKEVTE